MTIPDNTHSFASSSTILNSDVAPSTYLSILNPPQSLSPHTQSRSSVILGCFPSCLILSIGLSFSHLRHVPLNASCTECAPHDTTCCRSFSHRSCPFVEPFRSPRICLSIRGARSCRYWWWCCWICRRHQGWTRGSEGEGFFRNNDLGACGGYINIREKVLIGIKLLDCLH